MAGGPNFYAFAQNDPINGSDPNRLCDTGDISNTDDNPNFPDGDVFPDSNGTVNLCHGDGPDGTWESGAGLLTGVTVHGDWNGHNSTDVFNNLGQLLAPFNNAMTNGPSGVAVMMLISPSAEGGAAANVVRTEARNLAEQLALEEAEAGSRIMEGRIKDPAYPEDTWAKMEHVHTSLDGIDTVIHYWESIVTRIRTGFKFK